MRFYIDIPDAVSYGNVGAYLSGYLSGFTRLPKSRNSYVNRGRRAAWERGWLDGQRELGENSWRRIGRHIEPCVKRTEPQEPKDE